MYGLNSDIFILKNFSVVSSMRWSFINANPVNEFELQGKYHRKNHFITVGYEHLKIGAPNFDFIAVGGGIYL